MTRDDDGASTGGLVFNDLVRAVETLLVVRGPELVRERVGTDGAEVRSRALGEDVLLLESAVGQLQKNGARTAEG